MYKKLCLLFWLLATASIFSQEYQLKWEKDHFPSVFTDMKFSNDGNYIYAVDTPNLFIISAETGEILDRFNAEASGEYDASGIRKLYVPDNGKYIITFHNDSDLNYWDTETCEHSHSFSIPRDQGFGINGFDISDDGKLLLIDQARVENGFPVENTILLWDMETMTEKGRKVYPFEKHNGFELKLFPNKEKFLVATQRLYINNLLPGEDRLTLWNAETMEIEQTIDEKTYGENDIVTGYRILNVSPNQNLIAFQKSWTFYVYNLSIEETIYTSEEGRLCTDIEFLSNSNNAVIGYNTEFYLYDFTTNNKEIYEVQYADFINIFNDDLFYVGSGVFNNVYEKTLDLESKETSINININNNFIQINNESNLKIDFINIVNIKGEIVKRIITDQSQYNIKIYEKGLYFLKIKTNKGTITKKIIVGD